MKQLTFILILFFPFIFQNCSNQESTLNKVQEEAPHSRSIPIINDEDCVESDKIIINTIKSENKSELHNSYSNQNVFRLPSLKSEEFKQSDNEKHEVRTQAIFDDYDPEKI